MPVFRLSDALVFPSPHLATREGLLAVGGDLSPERLILAYQNGIFPWYSDREPILWWSPDPRMVLYPREIHISKSLRKTIEQGRFELSFDTAFPQVIAECARARRAASEGTWITPEMEAAYVRLHEMGVAHSVEARVQGELAGGLYGVSLGGVFFGESMFARVSDASKVCLVFLCFFLTEHRFSLIDCQVATGHLKSMGARMIPRQRFITQLKDSLHPRLPHGSWTRRSTDFFSILKSKSKSKSK